MRRRYSSTLSEIEGGVAETWLRNDQPGASEQTPTSPSFDRQCLEHFESVAHDIAISRLHGELWKDYFTIARLRPWIHGALGV